MKIRKYIVLYTFTHDFETLLLDVLLTSYVIYYGAYLTVSGFSPKDHIDASRGQFLRDFYLIFRSAYIIYEDPYQKS